MKRRNIALMILALALVAEPVFAQRRGGGRRGAEGSPGAGSEDKDGSSIKPYDEIIKEDAQTQKGLFTVHRQDGKIFYEIPPAALEKDMLWVTQLARTQAGFGYGGTGLGDRVVRWEKRDEKILLRDVKYTIRAETDDSIKNAVEATSVAPIIKAFSIQAWGKDQAPVIEVTDLFTSDVSEFSPGRRLSNASGMDSSRTFIENTKVFPENINVSVLATYRVSAGQDRGNQPGPRRRGGPRVDPSQSGVTVELHHSMVLLPENPMAPREFDSRVGFFTVGFEDYGTEEQEVEEKRYITRWRLEKKDPEAEVSEPVKPIVFYIGRGVPDKWRPYMIQGVEMWQPAFEKAGFKNAIIGKNAPSEREDPNWDAEDARISSIRWLPSTTENAMGPHVHDPRTGEILEADIIFYHNVLKLCRDWYFVQASPSDERAQQLPLPEELLGELLAYVVAHEVGHSLGFPHNMKASSSFTVEQLRDPEFTAKHGTEASIMDYGRFNYVAQPGDGATLIPKIGPYDFFVTEWGYSQFDAEKEQEQLAQIVARQRDNPMLRFGNPNPGEDPTQQTEDLGSDPVAATTLGLKNLERVAGYLVEATSKKGEDYSLLENMYGELVGQRARELGHVVSVVGGVVRDNVWYGDGDSQYELVSAERQKNAVAFLNEHAFTVPEYLTRDDILFRLEPTGAADRILGGQKSVLRGLFNDTRIKRMSEYQARAGDQPVYTPTELFTDVRNGIWSELNDVPVKTDLYRRNLQRAHIEQLVDMLGSDSESDLPALARGELHTIENLVGRAIGRGIQDAMTRHHLDDVLARIQKAFYPGAQPEAETAATPFGGGGFSEVIEERF